MVTIGFYHASIDLEKFYGQLIKKFEMEVVSGNPRNPPKTTPGLYTALTGIVHTACCNQTEFLYIYTRRLVKRLDNDAKPAQFIEEMPSAKTGYYLESNRLPYSRKFPRARIFVIFVNYEVITKIFITEI